jgi:hypothetical protein
LDDPPSEREEVHMRPQRFDSRALPFDDDQRLRRRLAAEHRRAPFSPTDARATVRRVVAVGREVGLATRVYRGGLDLGGSEVDHVWASVDGVVVDAAFPVLDAEFVDTLRRFVAGDAEPQDLARAAARCALTDRVVGVFPDRLRYVGCPVWTDRYRS